MDQTAQTQNSLNRTFAWLVGLTVVVAVVGAALFLGVGRGDQSAVDRLPASPVRGMADPNASALAAGGDQSAGRPVLEVTTGAGPVSTTSLPSPTPTLVSAGEAAAASAPSTSAVPSPVTSSTVPTSSSSTPTSLPGPDDPTTLPPATGPSSTPSGGEGLTVVELELARLTNELRTNPNGPLRREGAVIDCDGRVPIDPATGLYAPVGALTIDTVASLQVAREWSAQLTTNLQHRPQAGIAGLQGAGIDVAAAGENIAYHNFPDTASRHFTGWRESDGHFCNMMDPTFTHLGVGEVTRSDGFSFATQNLFSLR